MNSYFQPQDDFSHIDRIKTKWIQRQPIQGNASFNFQNESGEGKLLQLPDVFTSSRDRRNKSYRSPQKKRKSQFNIFESIEQPSYQLAPKKEKCQELQKMLLNYTRYKQSFNTGANRSMNSPLKKIHKQPENGYIRMNGIRFPLELYQIHKNRKQIIENLMNKSNSNIIQ